jgi:uncharacterized protein (DUF1330 family)
MPVLRQYGGRLVATDGGPEVIEGEWAGDRVVVLAFDDHVAFTMWFNSPEYQEIVTDRWAAAETTMLLVRGAD